jgi:hypothetical protein
MIIIVTVVVLFCSANYAHHNVSAVSEVEISALRNEFLSRPPDYFFKTEISSYSAILVW